MLHIPQKEFEGSDRADQSTRAHVDEPQADFKAS